MSPSPTSMACSNMGVGVRIRRKLAPFARKVLSGGVDGGTDQSRRLRGGPGDLDAARSSAGSGGPHAHPAQGDCGGRRGRPRARVPRHGGGLPPASSAARTRGGGARRKLQPAPGLGVRRIAQQLANLVDRIPHGTRIHLVGHSLGGIVSRWYVQEMGGDARVAQTIPIATPFGGAKVAERLRLFVGNDLHAGSDVLTRLRDGAARTQHVPHISIAGAEDRMVSPRLRWVLGWGAGRPRGARAQSAPFRSRGNQSRRGARDRSRARLESFRPRRPTW